MDYRGVITQEMVEEIQRKNEEKLKNALEYLGDKWILNPKNHVKRKTPFNKNMVRKNDEIND